MEHSPVIDWRRRQIARLVARQVWRIGDLIGWRPNISARRVNGAGQQVVKSRRYEQVEVCNTAQVAQRLGDSRLHAKQATKLIVDRPIEIGDPPSALGERADGVIQFEILPQSDLVAGSRNWAVRITTLQTVLFQ